MTSGTTGFTRRQTVALTAAPLLTGAALPQGQPSYRWRNVKVGAGGFIPGIVFSRVERDLAYARSDMGGAYRWDSGLSRWLPLQDDTPIGSDFGVESIAPDPVDPNIVHAAVGVSRHEQAAMLRSNDRGTTWRRTPVAFRMGGNEDGRGLGERLAIDPNDTRILYFGSRHDGLQRSIDGGLTWRRVDSFPLHGLGLDLNGPTHAGLSFVVFDPTSGTSGTGSRVILVGVADPGGPRLFRSVDPEAPGHPFRVGRVPSSPPPRPNWMIAGCSSSPAPSASVRTGSATVRSGDWTPEPMSGAKSLPRDPWAGSWAWPSTGTVPGRC